MKRTRQSLTAALTLFLFFAAMTAMLQSASAQEVTATITGTVTDPSGAALNGATVTATDTKRGTTWTAHTNETGLYNITRLPVGTYQVSASAAGFLTAKQADILMLDLNQTARLNFQMKMGNVSETVEVTGAAPILKTESAEVDTIINASTNDNLPLATRNPVQLTLLSAGAVTVDAASLNQGSNTAENGGRPYIDGNREQANNFLLDGVDNNQTSENRLGLTPSPDAIQEFNVITQNASAEFGNFQGGIVNTTIKSGTNNYHGDAFEFLRNDVLNANRWENGFLGVTKPALRWNIFGGTFGGPIIKNKLFFFGDYQGGRLDNPPAGNSINVLTPAEIGGNFSGLGVPILNPCAPNTGVSGTPCQLVPTGSRVPFTGNIIPANMLDPAFVKLTTSSLYPASSTGTAINNKGQQFNTDQGDIKIDYNFSQTDRINGRYSQGNQNDPTSNSVGLLGDQISVAHLYNTDLDWTHTFNPNLLNEARFGTNYVSFVNNNITFPGPVGALSSSLGINGATSAGLPRFGFGGGSITNPGSGSFTTLGDEVALENFATTVVQFNDNLIWTHGRHEIKFGYQMNRYRVNVFYAGNGGELGMLLYNGQYTAPSGASTANLDAAAAADFALGLPELVGHGVAGGGGWHQQNWLYAGYVQDNWRFSDTLTLNLGLRYEAVTPWIETDNRQVNVNPLTGALEYPGNAKVVGVGSNGFSRGLYNTTYGLPDWQPRIGFAWSPRMLDNKTVIRGAYTISSYLEGTGTNLRLTQNPPNTPPQSQAINVTSGTPFSSEAGPGAGSVIGGNPFINATMLAWAPTVQPAMAQQWNLTVQQEINKNTTLQVGYVGQHGTHLMVPEQLQQSVLNSDGSVSPTPFIGGPNPAGGFGPNQFGVVKLTASVGGMRYNALQTVLQHRYGHGLEGQLSYTYSKCMTDNSGYFGTWSSTTQATPSSPYFQNLYNSKADWAQCYWDSKHILSAYALYELPVGRGKDFAKDVSAPVNTVIGNWSVNPILSWHTGFPMALSGPDNSGTGSPGARPNCNDSLLSYPDTFVSDPSKGGPGFLWFNPNFETAAAKGTFGNCPAQGPVIGPGYVDADIGLQKNFLFTESMKLQFRADFLNAFNHPNLAHPNTSSGVVSASQDPREIQFGLKFYF